MKTCKLPKPNLKQIKDPALNDGEILHNNREEIGYKLFGQDFVHDLVGVLDLLLLLVVLMLQSQAN